MEELEWIMLNKENKLNNSVNAQDVDHTIIGMDQALVVMIQHLNIKHPFYCC